MSVRAPWLLAIGLLGIGSIEARGGPADEASRDPLARYFPAGDLVFYAEFQGLDAHAASWRKTATYRLLTETTTGAMLERTAEALLDRTLANAPMPSGVTLSGKEMLAIVEGMVKSGFAFGLNRRPDEPRPYSIGLVIAGAARGDSAAPIRRLLESAFADAKAKVETKAGGRKVTVTEGVETGGPGVAWWFEGQDLAFSVLATGGPDPLIDALEGKVPNATTHPLREELIRELDGFEPVGLAFVVREAFPAMPPQADRLGLDKIERIDYRWGFRGDALVTMTRLLAPAPRTGLLALLDHPTFGAKDLPPLPPGSEDFTVFSLDPDKFYEQFVKIAVMGDPNAQGAAAATEDGFRGVTGLELRKDVLAHVGPRVVVYSIPTKGILATNPFSGFVSGMVHAPKTVVSVQVRDPAGFAKSFKTLIAKANEVIRAQYGGADAERAKAIGFVPLKGMENSYVLNLPTMGVAMPAGLRPTVVLGKSSLFFATTTEMARGVLALEGTKPAQPDAAMASVLKGLPDSIMALNVSDTRDSLLPEIVANLPTLISTVSALGMGRGGPPMARALGIGPGGMGDPLGLNVDPALMPDPDTLRPYLFPAVYAVTVDAEGFAFVSRESFPGLNPTTVAPLAVATLLPAITAARTAARRSQSVNNLKQFGLALHNYYSVNDHLPTDIRDADGKALLSWRVQILPYMEGQALYNEFHLDEPWDSEHNKGLIEQMPAVFAVPSGHAPAGRTFYRGLSGARTLFDPEAPEGLSFAAITDGLSNTIAAVEAREAVEWTRPDTEIPFVPDDDGLAKKLGGHFPGGFNVLFMDGSVRFVKDTININALRSLITRNGGEVVPVGAF